MADDKMLDAFGNKLKAPTEEDIKKVLDPKYRSYKFTYIPKLNLYVADELSKFKKNWYECKEELKKEGSRMLTPAEFWIYYDYCVENRPDIIVKSIKAVAKEEWLDAIVDKEDLIINPDVDGAKYSKGEVHKGVIKKEKGGFTKHHILPNTGLPSFLSKEGGDFRYLRSNSPFKETVAVTISVKTDEFNESQLFLLLETPPDYALRFIGVREVKTEVEEDEISDKIITIEKASL